ncbi:MAG: hypothetical protein ACYTGW_08125 [Planctomycetota bacterium]|jgi:hypothetical protein
MKQTLLPLVLAVAACQQPAPNVPPEGKVADAAAKTEATETPATITAAQKEYDTLQAGFQQAYDAYVAESRALAKTPAYQEARKNRDREAMTALRQSLKAPQAAWVPKFQDAAEKYEGDDRARFLVWITTNAYGRDATGAQDALEALLKDHIDSMLLADMIKGYGVVRGAGNADRAREVYGEIFAKSPHDLVKALACFYRAQAVQRDRNATAADKQAAERDLAMAEQLAPADSTLALRIAAPKFERERLQVGMVAPDIVGEDIDGVKFALSDYRGKVVVLDFWGDW